MGFNYSAKGLLLCGPFPLSQYLDGKMLAVGINEFAMSLTYPNAIRLVPALFWTNRGIKTRPACSGCGYVRGDTDIYGSFMAWRCADGRISALGIGTEISRPLCNRFNCSLSKIVSHEGPDCSQVSLYSIS